MGVASPQLKTLLLESISSTTSLMRLLSDFPEISTSEVMSYDIRKWYCEGCKRCHSKNQQTELILQHAVCVPVILFEVRLLDVMMVTSALSFAQASLLCEV